MIIARILLLLVTIPAVLSAAPSGKVVELHSCEVYTGGCTASSEATLGGRSLFRMWHFTSGKFNDVDLTGTSIAAVEIADASLGFRDTKTSAAVIYVSNTASKAQQSAAVEWLRAGELREASAVRDVRAVELAFSGKGDEIRLRAGEAASLVTASLPDCGTGSCGEALWYQPRSTMDQFAVLQDAGSSINEPLLELKWRNNGTRSVFVGSFGNSATLAQAMP